MNNSSPPPTTPPLLLHHICHDNQRGDGNYDDDDNFKYDAPPSSDLEHLFYCYLGHMWIQDWRIMMYHRVTVIVLVF